MKVPSDKPIVASARLDGRNSPTLDAAALALEAMVLFVITVEAAFGEKSGHGWPLRNSKIWSRGYCDHLEKAAITDDRMKKVSPWTDVPTFAELAP